MEYVRWQIPSFVGAGFSAQAHVSGDVDGIFGGRCVCCARAWHPCGGAASFTAGVHERQVVAREDVGLAVVVLRSRK